MKLPKHVAYGLWCFGVSVALGIPTTIIFSFTAPPEALRSTMVLSGVISFLLLAILGYLIFKAHNWARWVNAVLATLTFLGSFLLLSPLSPNTAILYIRWVQVVLGMLAVIYLFTPSANAWFKDPSNAL
ncbi:MAG: hypothetical protein ACYC9L_16670 [Sulfuricaulis sp.]